VPIEWTGYYVRVKQANGALAWTSPVYLRRTT
jgi:hypothetical protein